MHAQSVLLGIYSCTVVDVALKITTEKGVEGLKGEEIGDGDCTRYCSLVASSEFVCAIHP